MPLPQKVIEQLGREPARTPGWSGRLLMVSSTAFFAAIGVYLGITFGMRPYFEGELNALQDRITKKAEAISADEQANITIFHAQLTNIKTLLDKRMLASRLFGWLEANTQPNVAFTTLAFGGDKELEVKLNGTARSVSDFVDQARHFEDRPEVAKAVFSNLSLGDKTGWQFEAVLTLRDGVLTGAPPAGSGSNEEKTEQTAP